MYKQIAWSAVQTYSERIQRAGPEVQNLMKSLFSKLQMHSFDFECISQIFMIQVFNILCETWWRQNSSINPL